MILLSMLGMLAIVSLWLYDGYVNKREGLVLEVERSFFNSIQSYYEDHQEAIDEKRKQYFSREGDKFIQELKKVYPHINEEAYQSIWDSLILERMKKYQVKREAKIEPTEPSTLIPSFLLQNIDFTPETIQRLDGLLRESLRRKGINTDISVELVVLTEKPKRKGSTIVQIDADGCMVTRPVLVNPMQQQYLLARFDQPVLYLLGKLWTQLALAMLLLLALLATFVYVLWTIQRQNKMALLRKSFVNNMTHELKTPVATVMAAIESVQRYGAKNDKFKMERYLEISKQELEHLTTMIEKVLQLDIDEMKGMVLQKVDIDLIPLLQQCLETAQISARKKTSITLVDSPESVYIHADAAHLKNVFSNLLDNALKYAKEEVQVQISVKVIGKAVEIRVQDNGIGIASTYHNDIFDMFFRVPNGNLYAVKGFGLGLAYVKQVMLQHQGSVKVSSVVGEGTVFILNIPIR